MKLSETSLVLAKVAALDNRRLDPENADPTNPEQAPILHAWHEVIGDLSFRDCRDAVKHHRTTSTDWLQPAHIRQIVSVVRAARSDSVTNAELVADLEYDDPSYIPTLQARRAAVLDGADPTEVLTLIPRVKVRELTGGDL